MTRMVAVESEWETRQERERRIGGARRARRKDLRPTRPPEAESLLRDLRSQRTFTDADLRQLVARDFDQPVVSLYLNLSPEEAVREGKTARLRLLNSMRHAELAARRYLVDRLAPVQKAILQRDLDELETLLEIPDLDGHRSAVAFKSGQQLQRAAALHVRLPNSLTVDIDPYVAPLEVTLETHPPALLLEVSKQRSRFWMLRLGELQEIDGVESFVPADTVDRSRPGKVLRHRQAHLWWHLRETARVATQLLDENLRALLILAGDQRVLAELEEFLPERLRARVAGRLQQSPGTDPAELERRLENVLREYRRGVEAAELDRLGDYQAAGVLMSGLAETLAMWNLFFLRRLFLSSGLQQPGFLCKEHHFLALEPGRCPFDEAEPFPVGDVVAELVGWARLHGVDLLLIETLGERLEPHQGVAGVTYRMADPGA